jgi:anti-sigma factor RsiW
VPDASIDRPQAQRPCPARRRRRSRCTRTPPAGAMSHSPGVSAPHAGSMATGLDEQCVLTTMTGPRRSRANASRPATPAV